MADLSAKERIMRLETQIADHCRTNDEKFAGIKLDIEEVKGNLGDVKESLEDLRTNHIVFKTKAMVIWAVAIAVLSTVLQFVISYILKII